MASTNHPSLARAVASVSASVTPSNITSNSTLRYFSPPSAKDLVLLPFRFVSRVDHFLFSTLPRTVVRTTGLDQLTHRIAGIFTGGGAEAATGAAGGAAQAGAADIPAAAAAGTWTGLVTDALQASTFKSYLGMVQYLTSRWAFTCFILALVLNRISVYSSSRQRIVLTWNKRLALRLIPIMLFIAQLHQLTRAIKCQTSLDYSLYRHGDNSRVSLLDWSHDGGVLHDVSSTLLFWEDDPASCAAVGMSRPEPGTRAKKGSFSLLWPTFLRLSVSHIIENLSCSLQHVPVMTEVGISVFEHSLAFGEAESMVSHTLDAGLSIARAANITLNNATSTSTTAAAVQSNLTISASGAILAITDVVHGLAGPHAFDRINVPVEVLLVAWLSCGNALTSHIISVLGKQRQLRLINTGVWGIAYMAAFVVGLFTESNMVRTDYGDPRPISGLLHFPTVAVVGFLPHIIIILGIFVCGIIYLAALLLTAVSLGTNSNIPQPTRLAERFAIAHNNLQMSLHMKGMSIRWHEDFYTALLRLGFAALTAASEAVFLNEGRSVEMRQFTWLEEERLDELEMSAEQKKFSEGTQFQIVEEYGIPGSTIDAAGNVESQWQSGYSKERKVEKPKDKDTQDANSFVYPNPRADGVGALQRTTRFYLLIIFLRGVLFTVAGWMAFALGRLLDRIGITARPNWLRKLVGHSLKKVSKEGNRARQVHTSESLEFWVQNERGVLERPKTEDYDIEPEMRRRLQQEDVDDMDQRLDEKMYDWWKKGGWYGNKDDSGDYNVPVRSIEEDDDTTSVVSMATSTSTISSQHDEQAWESESEGRRTPTQSRPTWSFDRVARPRSQTPSDTNMLDHTLLARLLNPQDSATREEARILASHLAGDTIVTRSRYRQQYQAERSQVLLAGRAHVGTVYGTGITPQRATGPLSNEDEASVLESLLIARRTEKARRRQRQDHEQHPHLHKRPLAVAPDDDNQSHTLNGPLCVVCQAEPRSIIAWPCRCLTVCEDCRVSLAMNNFGNCVTCRRSVGGFVRLYVP